jgi:hypothetical protein
MESRAHVSFCEARLAVKKVHRRFSRFFGTVGLLNGREGENPGFGGPAWTPMMTRWTGRSYRFWSSWQSTELDVEQQRRRGLFKEVRHFSEIENAGRAIGRRLIRLSQTR